jgi:hypothetical protein
MWAATAIETTRAMKLTRIAIPRRGPAAFNIGEVSANTIGAVVPVVSKSSMEPVILVDSR